MLRAMTRVLSGSSPRMRGALLHTVASLAGRRIIPAYAGSTVVRSVCSQCGQDHPRVCGEHNIVGGMYDLKKGSSPRMRGAPAGAVQSAAEIGIIPAYAGSTHSWPLSRSSMTDHPRVCGEHRPLDVYCHMAAGSSPRMRGALTAGRGFALKIGIIPAYAGSTRKTSERLIPPWDHPRVCGEHPP